jgi:hypothetical protein
MDDKALNEMVNSAVERALGGSGDKQPAPTAAPVAKAAPAADRIDKLIDLMTLQATTAMAQNPAFRSQGGASGAPVVASAYNPNDPSTLNRASKEEVAGLVRDGKLRQAADAYRNSLPGGTGSIFRKHVTK